MRDQAAATEADDPVELLSHPATDDDLDDLLDDAAPRRRSKLTIALVIGLVFLLGFLFGSTAEKVAISIREAQAAAADEPNGESVTSESGPTVIGTVVLLGDGVIYIERPDGASVTVRVSDRTLVGLSEPGDVADLAPGAAVIVYGPTAEDGTVDASRIQQSRSVP